MMKFRIKKNNNWAVQIVMSSPEKWPRTARITCGGAAPFLNHPPTGFRLRVSEGETLHSFPGPTLLNPYFWEGMSEGLVDQP